MYKTDVLFESSPRYVVGAWGDSCGRTVNAETAEHAGHSCPPLRVLRVLRRLSCRLLLLAGLARRLLRARLLRARLLRARLLRALLLGFLGGRRLLLLRAGRLLLRALAGLLRGLGRAL